MNEKTEKKWSQGLRKQTREAVDGISGINPVTGCLHMKSVRGKSGVIRAQNLVSENLIIETSDGEIVTFADVDALLDAGWAID